MCTNVDSSQFSSNGIDCSTSSRVGALAIVFKRPNPDALFLNQRGELFDDVSSVAFEISNRSGSYKRAVQITSTGQIVVK